MEKIEIKVGWISEASKRADGGVESVRKGIRPLKK